MLTKRVDPLDVVAGQALQLEIDVNWPQEEPK